MIITIYIDALRYLGEFYDENKANTSRESAASLPEVVRKCETVNPLDHGDKTQRTGQIYCSDKDREYVATDKQKVKLVDREKGARIFWRCVQLVNITNQRRYGHGVDSVVARYELSDED